MTCCAAIVVAPDRILAATDGIVRVPQVGVRAATKMFAIPHVPMIVIGRGLLSYLSMLAGNLFCAEPGIFGQMHDMPAVLNDVFGMVAGRFGPDADKNDVVFAGWDGARMAIAEFSQRDRRQGFRLEPRADHYVVPWDQRLDHLTKPTNLAELATLTRAQIELSRSCDPSIVVGPPIMLAELIPTRVIFERVTDGGGGAP